MSESVNCRCVLGHCYMTYVTLTYSREQAQLSARAYRRIIIYSYTINSKGIQTYSYTITAGAYKPIQLYNNSEGLNVQTYNYRKKQ